jgi:parvulin-like peptidyl-prolyl isomerase
MQMRKVAVMCVLALALVSCSKKEAEVKGTFLAKIDNTAITQADYDREFQTLPDYAQQIFSDDAGKEKFLNEIINKELLYKEAVRKGYDKGQDYLKKVEEFKKLSLVSELFEKEIMAKAKVSDQEAKDYYDKNKDEFVAAKEIKASHILVKTEDEALKVLSRLKNGEKFEAVAKAVSIDTGSAKNGGDLGFFKKGQMVPEFERAAASLKVGSITTSPVKSPFGYHIIKVTDKKTGEPIPYDKVREMLSQKLSGEKQKGAFDTYIAELKKTHTVEINKAALTAKPEEKKAEPNKEAPKK